MPYKLEWHCNNHIVHFDMIGKIDADEMEEACNRIRDEYLETGTAPIHLIVDGRSVEQYPNDIRLIHRATSLYANHENIGWVVIIGAQNRTSVFFANVVLQSLKRNFRMVGSLEEALAVIERVDIGSKQVTL